MGFPEQTIALADLAGDWNFLGCDRSNRTDPLAPSSMNATFSATGGVTFTSLCSDAKTCLTTCVRARCKPAGRVVLKLTSLRRDGNTHRRQSLLELMLRLAALLPRQGCTCSTSLSCSIPTPGRARVWFRQRSPGSTQSQPM